MKPTEDEHTPWPWNPALLFCPGTGQYHRFGCACARENPNLVPASLRRWYEENWREVRAHRR
jgi:hypothetical protein